MTKPSRPAADALIGKALLDLLERTACGGALLSGDGQVIQANEIAERLLRKGGESRQLSSSQGREALKRLLAAGSKRFNKSGETWLVIKREDKRQLLLHAVVVGEPQCDGPHTLVIMIDLDLSPRLNASNLRDIFDLSPAEAKLASRIAAGRNLSEVAEEIGVSTATARSQLASIFNKTQTRRQGQLAALLARVSVLP